MNHKTNNTNHAEIKQEGNFTESKPVIYLAGGCFWGMEHLMQSLPGVINAVSGYANGSGKEDAFYEKVLTKTTGFKETVQVEYDPKRISLEAILYAYFYVIDPTVKNRQGNDVGPQYQTGIYYSDENSKEVVERIAALEKDRQAAFHVEIGPLINFYPAEEYHQDYLIKNPTGYCHISPREIQVLSKLRIDPGHYPRPKEDILRNKLTEEQFQVTQRSGTEAPFTNEFWNHFEEGIYVDIVTGEPLFSSLDKFESSCGWPAFSKPLEEPTVRNYLDTSHGMKRIEVRSRTGDSHLGHVFTGESESPNGIRYCINSAALRFIPRDKMEAEGYGYLLDIFLTIQSQANL